MTAEIVRLRRRAQSDPPLGDEALASAASTGDPAAVAELFDRFCDRVTRFLSRAVGPSPDVEDLLQATFLEIAKGPGAVRGPVVGAHLGARHRDERRPPSPALAGTAAEARARGGGGRSRVGDF